MKKALALVALAFAYFHWNKDPYPESISSSFQVDDWTGSYFSACR